ncbi:MAG: histidine phosphatase family protein, partial [Verrucomicrobia bacterium]|nr:histidine phosphatase family protein [Verrucomicrobiota bacterium]
MKIKTILIFLSFCLFQCEATTFLIVRHGETDWNRVGTIQGQKDIPLNETGILQAQKCSICISNRHKDIAAIYSSDLLRA